MNMNKAYKKKRNKTTVIKFKNKLYFSEQGFKDLINICHKSYRKDTADLLLGKYKNKNRRNKDTITKQSVGAINRNRPPLSINILKFDNEIFLIANELVESVNCPSRDFMKALDKKIFFDKLNNSFKVSVIWDKWNLLEYKDSPMDKGKDTFLELLYKRLYIS